MWSYQIGNKERASTILIAQLWKPGTNVDCFDLEADQWYLQPKPDHHPPPPPLWGKLTSKYCQGQPPLQGLTRKSRSGLSILLWQEGKIKKHILWKLKEPFRAHLGEGGLDGTNSFSSSSSSSTLSFSSWDLRHLTIILRLGPKKIKQFFSSSNSSLTSTEIYNWND